MPFPGLDKPLQLLPWQEEEILALLALGGPPPRWWALSPRLWRVQALRRTIEKIERYQLLLICRICDEPLVHVGEEAMTGVFWFDCPGPGCEHVLDFRADDPSVFTTLDEHLQQSGWSLLKLLQQKP